MISEVSLNSDWRFFRPTDGMIPFPVVEPDFDDREWASVDLPHDWGVELDYDLEAPGGHGFGFLRSGVGVYRRVLQIPSSWLDDRVLLCFEGVFRHSDVFVNGIHLGHRANGWVAFRHEITQALHAGPNLVAVLVNNTRQPAARWYTGSGINRPVRLLRVPTTWIDPDHLIVRQTHGEGVILDIETTVHGPGPDLRIDHRLIDPEGKSAGTVLGPVERPCRLLIERPRLWSPKDPALYTLDTRLTRDGVKIDRIQTRIGLRGIALTSREGFLLNGEGIKLKGFCIHEDHGPLGTALPEKAWRSKLAQLKNMGCNAIRCGHHPFSRIFYHLCDELGILVVDELFDGWDKPKAAEDYGHDWHANWRRDLADTLRQHINHPSIVFWSIGNEVHGQTDEKTRLIVDAVKRIDTSRPVIMGRGYPDCLDATCFNGQAEKPGVLETFHAEHPERPVVLTETPHTYATRGVYRTRTWLRDPGVPHFDVPNLTSRELFVYDSHRNHSSYDNSTIRIGIRECWRRTAGFDFVAGQFHWTYWDYAGEGEYHGSGCAGERDGRFWPRGVVDMAMIRKDPSYYYESQFSSRPMIHLLPHWTHPELEPGTGVPVWAYTNGEEAELFLNGESLGRQSVPAYGNAAWEVPWRPGTLEAVAYRDGLEVARSHQRSATNPAQIALLPDDPLLGVDRNDFTRVLIQARDDDNTLVPWASNPVALHVDGHHRFLGAENGDRLDFTALRSRTRRLYFGQMAVFIGATDAPGDIILTAASLLGARHFTATTRVTLGVEALGLRGAVRGPSPCARFTVDGTPCTPDSPVWKDPLVLGESTRVRVTLYRGNTPLLELEEVFQHGPAPTQPAPPGHNPDDDPCVAGPRDPEAAGLWSSPDGERYRLHPDGDILVIPANGTPSPAGRWWYDYPNDRDEDPNNHGTGEWVTLQGLRQAMALTSRDARQLRVHRGNQARLLTKLGTPHPEVSP